ncbi:uroporphyrinogen decarboxylase [Luminiphilus sp.]|nr:uroporphyrinogen decarboxylase [Luminiphilus sp.]MDB4839587.1 uroporphyrinogen decarboxylase [Amylibacter sp.]MDA8985931.1 uroporphyrinogen decarboxylase [Luminiphilus sp.]MDA9941277.1 uroporphyrinogen decarboxylase [Luminiphilus sp.]MDB2644247.1 uroporphyrinogen decarboxylase [Luminiphilus sp.]MDB4049439.1 uroporphyrinogen decarboxylase [Luminiphilus sp.]
MASLENDRFLRALLREPVDRTPLWMMRQAGRYLPEYREIRAEAGSFMNLCTNPELACEVTLQPLRRYAMDAAILFSDILTVPDALGLGLYFSEGEGPRFERPLSTAAEINALDPARAASELGYVMDAVSLIRRELKGSIPLIGFAGSPWTLATYMVEGGSSKDFAKVKSLAFNEPELMHQLLSKLATSVAAYLSEQIRSGAQAVQIFDTWGGALSHNAYREFSLRYMTEIIDQLPREADGRKVPVIVFTKGGGQWLEAIADCGADAVGLDWTTDIGAARERVGDRVCLQGNMDPTLLNASPERIREEVEQILTSFGQGSGHVFNLGHGITPGINPDHVAAMVDAVVELSPAYH